MRFKNKWLNRVTAAVLTIGMALTPAVMNSGVTYADVKDIESPIPVTQSEEAMNLLTKTVEIGDEKYEISMELDESQLELKVGEYQEVNITLTAKPEDFTSSDAISTALEEGCTWSCDDSSVVDISDAPDAAKIKGIKAGNAKVTASLTIANVEFEISCNIIVTEDETPVTPEEPEIKLSQDKVILFPGESVKINVEPKDRDYEWSVSKKDFLDIKDGTITARNYIGTQIITVKDKKTGKTAECEVTVVRVRSQEYLLEVGQSVEVILSTNREDVDVSVLELTVPSSENGIEVSGCKLTAKKEGCYEVGVKKGESILNKTVHVQVVAQGQKIATAYSDIKEHEDFHNSSSIEVEDPDNLLNAYNDVWIPMLSDEVLLIS